MIYNELMARYRDGGEPNFCRMSFVTENLSIAANDSACRRQILEIILEGVWKALGMEGPGYTEVASIFAEVGVDEVLRMGLKAGFETLLSKKGL